MCSFLEAEVLRLAGPLVDVSGSNVAFDHFQLETIEPYLASAVDERTEPDRRRFWRDIEHELVPSPSRASFDRPALHVVERQGMTTFGPVDSHPEAGPTGDLVG